MTASNGGPAPADDTTGAEAGTGAGPGSGAGSGSAGGSGADAGSGAGARTSTGTGTGAGGGLGTGPGLGSAASPGDTVAAVVRQWRAVHPELDTGPMEVIGRINRCAALLQQAEDAPLRRAGLSRPEFDLLGALRRTGHELTPGELARETFSSGAAVTKRLKQLTERGLVERRGDTRDRRVAHLRLTDTGRDLVDGILPEQLAYETAVLSILAPEGQAELAILLGELLGRLEGRTGALRA
ncbi:MarR family winged helix-turn-helix transcriptional regulator [Streptomyces sp. MUSC 14]|uniref:MarR family winged helix-turn-helix transcriptional regulator n=1 Tax=Streptomyces sp. MUSC 14 TaxID=1354889 RepID=UPI000A83C7E2|nr:MarR family transcriptional regulator [Streptomyces sp. MUSC 14]